MIKYEFAFTIYALDACLVMLFLGIGGWQKLPQFASIVATSLAGAIVVWHYCAR